MGVTTGTPICPPRMKEMIKPAICERTQPKDWEDWSGNMAGFWHNKNIQVEVFGPRIH